MKVEFSQQSFEKYSNIKFLENVSSGSRVVAYGQTDGRTDMTKLIVALRNFANAPKIAQVHFWRTSRPQSLLLIVLPKTVREKCW